MGIDPVKSVFATGTPVDKSALVGLDISRIRLGVANADEIRNTDFSGRTGGLYVGSTQIPYDLDPADTTTPDDGTDSSNCIIDSAGNRFKNSQVGLLANLATLLAEANAVIASSVATVAAEPTLTGSRKITVAAPLTLSDGGAGANLLFGFTLPVPVSGGGTGMTTFSVPSNKRNAFSASHNIVNADKNSCVTFTNPGGGYVCTFLNPSGYDSDFSCIVTNESGSRAVTLVLTNYADGTTLTTRLYPLQSYFVYSNNGHWFLLGGLKRWFTASGVTFYVDPSGADTNDGMAAGAGGYMKTVLACWNRIRDETDIAAASSGVTIQLTPGVTYPPCGELDGDKPGGFGKLVAIVGDPTLVNPPRIIGAGADNCVVLRDGAWAQFSGLVFGSTGSGSNGAWMQQKSLGDFSNCEWGSMLAGNHIFVDDGADANISGAQSIAGNADTHWSVQNGGKLIVGGVNIDGGGGNWNFPTAFLIASMLARIQFQAPAFPNCGSITGPRILIQRHSVFDGGSVTVPGNSAGTVDATSTAY